MGFGMANRYVTIATPILCLVYVAWVVNGPHRIGRTIQLCLFALACLTLPSNIHLGLRFGEGRCASLKPVERGSKRHLPGTEFVARFGDDYTQYRHLIFLYVRAKERENWQLSVVL